MSAGLFNATCPDCGEDLQIDESGNGTCTACGHTYLNRVGYLIPVEVPADQPAQETVDDAGGALQ